MDSVLRAGKFRGGMRLALYQPDIAQNTGTILRLCACFGVPVDVIGPAGFDMSDKALKRAALDYLTHADVSRHQSFEAFLAQRAGGPTCRLVLLTTHGDLAYSDFAFRPTDTLLLGRESAGCPAHIHQRADARIAIPIRHGLRSLNVAVAAGIVLAEALRQTGGLPALSREARLSHA